MRGERGNDVIIVLVGNKTDLNDKREVTTAQGEEEAKKNGLMFIETSAKVGHTPPSPRGLSDITAFAIPLPSSRS